MEETQCRSARGKLHLKYALQAIRLWFAMPGVETPVRSYVDLFHRSGSHGALVDFARANDPARLTHAVEYLGKSLANRRDDIARSGGSRCEKHVEMADSIEKCIQQLSEVRVKAARSAPDEAAGSPRDTQELAADDMVRVLDKAFGLGELRTLLGKLKRQPEAGELEAKVEVLLANTKKQELLVLLVGLRVRERAGLVGFVEWMLHKGMVTKKALMDGARASGLKHLLKRIKGLVARPAKRARVDGATGGGQEEAAEEEENNLPVAAAGSDA